MSISPVSHREHDQQPSAKWCFVCGVENPCGLKIRFFNNGPHGVRATVVLGDEYQSYPGIVHGGILSTILDEAMGRAVLSPDGATPDGADPRFMFTLRMDVRYRKPVPLHQPFVVEARVERDRGRTVQASARIMLQDGAVAVEASGTLIDIPPEQIDEMKRADVGWQVYPVEPGDELEEPRSEA